MISTGDQREVAQYIDQPWLMTYVNARTISTEHHSNNNNNNNNNLTSIARFDSLLMFASVLINILFP